MSSLHVEPVETGTTETDQRLSSNSEQADQKSDSFPRLSTILAVLLIGVYFGIVLTMEQWEDLSARLKAAGVAFGIEPYVRFKGQVGEQATMFFTDPSGNALEFKAFADDVQLFAS